MDCNTARLLLAFARPQANDLDAADMVELDTHLAGCPDCAPFAARQRGFDDAVGRVLRKVDVPDRLGPLLHEQLGLDLTTKLHHRAVWRYAAAAVVLIALVAGVGSWSLWPKPRLDGEQMWADLQGSQPGLTEIEKFYRDNGSEVVLPRDLQYGHLKFPLGFSEFQGQKVPCLFFVNHDGNYASVRVLSAQKFDFHNQKEFHSPPDDSYPKLLIDFSPDRRFAYLIVYTGKDLNWLRPNGGGAL